jgi:tricorn protease
MLVTLAAAALATDGYLRQPDIHGDTIVFTADGDLWTVAAAGGVAKRITAHPGDERSAHFSPDGSLIAFTGEYDGNTDVFVVAASGGEPRRLTWHPDADDAVGFTPDGKSVIFRSVRTDPNHVWRLYTVPVTGGDATEMPLGWASRIDIDPTSGKYAFTRLGRESATWKRYRGGSADDIWVGDPAKGDYAQITTFTGPDSFPMWHDGRVYFQSDLGGTANLWSMAADGSDRQQLTHVEGGWDLRWPAMGPDGRVVFMLAGDVHLWDPATKAEKKVPIDLPGERVLARERFEDAGAWVSSFALAPNADRVVVTARGEVFSLPVKPGVALPVTRGSGARESWAAYSPDGKRVVYVTDASGEEAIATADAWGRGDEKIVVPPAAKGWHFPPVWSPDGKRIAYADETQTLYVVSADGTAVPKAVDRSGQSEIREYTWSPDGRYLAYSKQDRRAVMSIYVYDAVEGDIHPVGGTNTSNYAPAWDPDGRYLYFLSDRHTNPMLGTRDFQEILLPDTVPYAVLLRPDVPNPFADNAGLPPAPDNPAPQAAAEESKKAKKKKDKKDELKLLEPTEMPLPAVTITWQGIDDRILAFPVAPGPYWGLQATSAKVFWARSPLSGMNDASDSSGGATLVSFDLEAKEASDYLSGVYGFDVAPKASKVAVYLGPWQLYVLDAGGVGDMSQGQVALGDATIDVDPREEWKQIFNEAWRNERDFFWDAGMSGLDWKAIHDLYGSLLPRISTRYDLDDLLGEMIGELGTSHTYVGGGDRGVNVDWVPNGLLGADFARDGEAFRITHILRGDPADEVSSPLAEPGAGIKEGDYILAINHQPVRKDVPIEAMLQADAGKRVLLTVNGTPTDRGARDVLVTPVYDDARLRYVDWVRKNREYVAAKTDGKIGYIHVPDMGGPGLVAFETWLYPQSDKDGLVIDVRWNRGGFVSQLLLEKLRRPILGYDLTRNGAVSPYPYAQRRGPFVVLTNNFAGSDGDIFPRAVQVEGLAPVIGERSWGGVVGIRGDKPMVDGGFLTEPEFAFWFRQGGWSVENQGVVPDIQVGWSPADAAAGHDTQLDAAIAEVLKRVKENPPLPYPTDPGTDKSRKAYERENEPKGK